MDNSNHPDKEAQEVGVAVVGLYVYKFFHNVKGARLLIGRSRARGGGYSVISSFWIPSSDVTTMLE